MATHHMHSVYQANSTNNVAPPAFRTIERSIPTTTSFAQWRYPPDFAGGALYARVHFNAWGRGSGSPTAPTPPGLTVVSLYREGSGTALDTDSKTMSALVGGRAFAVFDLQDTTAPWAAGDAISFGVDVSSGDANINSFYILISDEPIP